jgi:hypothetical protein
MKMPRLRLSVRASLVLVLAVACLFGWAVHRANTQRDAVSAIRRAGGTALYDWESHMVPGPGRIHDRLVPVPSGRPLWPGWLVTILGPDYFGNVKVVGFNKHVSDLDGVMAHVGRLRQLEFLYVASGGKLSRVGTAHLRGLHRLRILKLLLPSGGPRRGAEGLRGDAPSSET